MKYIFQLGLCAGLLTTGCSTLQKSELNTTDFNAIQGSWRGRVVQGSTRNPCSFVVSGRNFEFHDLAETNVWYQGTFSLREDTIPRRYVASISACPFTQYVGQTVIAIYRLDHGNLTITANEPGNPAIPTSFDAPDASTLEVKRADGKD